MAGGPSQVRTDDLMLAKHALYQLSYGPGCLFSAQKFLAFRGLC